MTYESYQIKNFENRLSNPEYIKIENNVIKWDIQLYADRMLKPENNRAWIYELKKEKLKTLIESEENNK